MQGNFESLKSVKMSNNAVDISRVSKVVGYKITTGNQTNSTANLPQRIAVFAEANNANQSTLSLTPTEITNLKQAGDLYGYGSPMYHAIRILRPINGGGVGSIPVIAYPQAEAAGATAKIFEIVPSGTATDNGTHTIVIAGRGNVDGQAYDISVVIGDTVATILGKINAAINAVIGCPFTSVNFGYEVDLTSKWKGATANDLTVSVNTNGKSCGITYAVNSLQNGTGTPSVQAALDLFGTDWNTIVLNSYALNTTVLTTLETFNGVPDPDNPTGRFQGVIMKPFIAITGSVNDNDSAITDARLNNLTNAIAPAPLSKALPLEAAANMVVLAATTFQDNPHLDVSGKSYPDMPVPESGGIGTMGIYTNRDTYVKKGNSTVDFVGGKYVVMDFVTTWHPAGEVVPQFLFCRNIMIDLNVRFAYYIEEQKYLVDHAIAADDTDVSASKVIKPKGWKSILYKLAETLGRKGLIADPVFMQDSITVEISSSNPNRIDTFFRYERTGFARVSSTIAQANFKFGN